jgi:hypothetical protein
VEQTVVNGTGYAGGIAGQNGGSIRDVVFVHNSNPNVNDNQPPVRGPNSGGIAGSNTGSITTALYLAPAPRVGSVLYPIQRIPGGTVTNAYYLHGIRHRIRPADALFRTENYNWPAGDSVIGMGMYTWHFSDGRVLPLMGVDAFNTGGDSPWRRTAGYPYPHLDGLRPASWPETDGDSAGNITLEREWEQVEDDLFEVTLRITPTVEGLSAEGDVTVSLPWYFDFYGEVRNGAGNIIPAVRTGRSKVIRVSLAGAEVEVVYFIRHTPGDNASGFGSLPDSLDTSYLFVEIEGDTRRPFLMAFPEADPHISIPMPNP